MGADRSFTDYVKKRFDNNFWAVADEYLSENTDLIEKLAEKLHRVGEHEISDVKTEYVWVEDQPGMEIRFDVALSVTIEIKDGDYHYDDSVERTIWIIVNCRGNFDTNLDDFEILDYGYYNGKSKAQHPMDDSLVPYITSDKLEQEAEAFLQRYFPEALRVPLRGQAPVWVDPTELAKKMGLKINSHRIKEDASIFGQLYFVDTEADIFSETEDKNVKTHISGKTIMVDPQTYLLRNLGSINNTIIHECVHWDKHRKAFKLEQLYNESSTCISCVVVGGAATGISKKATEFMEWQANQLAPRIQMPKEPFIQRAKDCISRYMRELNLAHEIDVMEAVIETLGIEFGVSRQAAKIRLVELGFESAIGTYTYVDGHYVRPHSFSKKTLELHQTYTIPTQDALIQRCINPKLKEKTKNGDYLFVENHYVYNAPLYVDYDEDGNLVLTDYARSHMDECCLVFDMTVVTKSINNAYHTLCYLNREPSDITFEVKYHNGYENSPQERQVALRQKQMSEWMDIRRKMTDDQSQCMELLLGWRKMKCTELADSIDISEKTVRRITKGENAPELKTAVRICFALHLPPMISEKLLEVFGCKLMPMNQEHQWIKEALVLKYPESYDLVVVWLSEFNVEI